MQRLEAGTGQPGRRIADAVLAEVASWRLDRYDSDAHQAGCAGAGSEALRAGMAAWVDEEAAGAVVGGGGQRLMVNGQLSMVNEGRRARCGFGRGWMMGSMRSGRPEEPVDPPAGWRPVWGRVDGRRPGECAGVGVARPGGAGAGDGELSGDGPGVARAVRGAGDRGADQVYGVWNDPGLIEG